VAGHDFEQLDHYQLLNVARSASLNEIKKAFRREITSYHPDRYVRASSPDKLYARQRSQRINEAFRILRDAKLREHYDMNMTGGAAIRPSQPVPTGPLAPRDHQAELYDTAKSYIDSGRLIQAVGVLRRLQQLNPFYRDVATLLATTEQTINARQLTMPYESLRRTSWITISIVAIVFVLVVIMWFLSDRQQISGAYTDATRTAVAKSTPATITPIITRTPRRTSTPQITNTPAPVDTSLLLDDGFITNEWAEATGPTWRTSYDGKRYHIEAQANGDAAWAYRPFDATDVHMTADIQINSGQGGLVIRYRAENNFVAVVLVPASQEYRILQRQDALFTELARGNNPSIQRDNLLEVTVVGKEVTLTINGNLVTSMPLESLTDSARFGMIAIPDTSNADVLFSHLTVRTTTTP
jgi:hypothetical protein